MSYRNSDLLARVSLTEGDGVVHKGGLVDGETKRNTDLVSASVFLTNLKAGLLDLGSKVSSLEESL